MGVPASRIRKLSYTRIFNLRVFVSQRGRKQCSTQVTRGKQLRYGLVIESPAGETKGSHKAT